MYVGSSIIELIQLAQLPPPSKDFVFKWPPPLNEL